MSASDVGFRYPDIVRAGIHLVLDTPAPVQIRVDPDGERKAEERRRRNQEWRERRRASGIHDDFPPELIRKMPPTKTVHLQWLDTSYEPVWRDADLHIDLERRMISNTDNQLLGGGHKGSGAIGVLLFASPVLLAISPYLYVRARVWQSKERTHGMSRHAIALLEKLEGQLDPETEELLKEAFRNGWAHHRKMSRVVTFQEASALLDACDLTERVHIEYAEPPTVLRDLVWQDVDGDAVGHAQFVNDVVHAFRVLGSDFEGDKAAALAGRFLTRVVLEEHE